MLERAAGDPEALRVMVIDDSKPFVKALVAGFAQQGVHADGVDEPSKLLRSTSDYHLADYDMIFLDMRLGAISGGALAAADLLLHVMSYYPTARVVTFTAADITIAECVRCIQLGALGMIPKSAEIDHLIQVALVYRAVGDQAMAREVRISSLWSLLSGETNLDTGRFLEMLMANLFASIDGMRVVSHNFHGAAGEYDLVVAQVCEAEFWRSLASHHLVIECKKTGNAIETSAFHILEGKVKNKKMCSAGILVSWSGVTRGARTLRTTEHHGTKLFSLDKRELLQLVKRKAEKREEYLRDVLSAQL